MTIGKLINNRMKSILCDITRLFFPDKDNKRCSWYEVMVILTPIGLLIILAVILSNKTKKRKEQLAWPTQCVQFFHQSHIFSHVVF